MDSEACFQVMMLMHEQPWLWPALFVARESGHSWREIRKQFRARCEAGETNLLPIPNNPD